MTPSDYITLRAATVATAYAAQIPGLIQIATGRTGRIFRDPLVRVEAIGLRVLHMIEKQSRNGVGGSITMETEGRLSRQYAAPMSDGDLNDTGWGRELLGLARGQGASLPLAACRRT